MLPCPACGETFAPATCGRLTCLMGHAFTLGPTVDNVSTLVRIDGLAPDEAEAMVEAAILVAEEAALSAYGTR